MALLNGIINGAQKNQSESPEIQQAEQNCQRAENAINDALLVLGRTVYETYKNTSGYEFNEQVTQVTECIKKSELWKQYRLTLDGKMKCDKCSSIITSDSAFCNKCGTKIDPLNFDSLGISTTKLVDSPNMCTSCGAPLVDGALFCEKCGCKIS